MKVGAAAVYAFDFDERHGETTPDLQARFKKTIEHIFSS
jgi:hypothetical protein